MSSSHAELGSSRLFLEKSSLNETAPQLYGPNLHTRSVQNV